MTKQLAGKRIILASEMLLVGGLQNQAMLLGRYLQEQGAVVRLLGYGQPEREFVRRLDVNNLAWRRVPYPWEDGVLPAIKSLGRFAGTLRSEQPDIIIPFSGPSNLACNLVWKTTGAKACIWNQRNPDGEGLSAFLTRIALRLTSHGTSNSRLGTEYLRQHGLSAAKITYIPDGIDVLREIPETSTDMPAADFTAIMVANLVEPKDHTTLLKAWRLVTDHLAARHQTAALLLAGRKGETYANVRRTIAALGLNNTVHLLGLRDDVPQLLAGIDIYVHSSASEGCPNAVLEAMRAALAVAGTAIPGIADVVSKNNRAYLAPAGDSRALATRIIALQADARMRASLGRDNQLKFQKEYSIERAGNKMSQLLNQLA